MTDKGYRSDALTLEELDTDGALREALESVGVDTRADFLKKATIGGAALLGAFALADDAAAAPNPNDAAILNYALTLEYVQAAFYTEAERERALRGNARRAASVVGPVERAHVTAFRKVLGSSAVKRPKFNFRGVTEKEKLFLETAVAFEDLAVAAYKAQAPRLRAPEMLAVAVAIHSVEARHAGWMRRLQGVVPASKAFDDPIDKPQTLRIVASTGFIQKEKVETKSKQRKPRFTG